MAEKKSILEEALLDITNIQNALNANTKEILRSVAKEEIDSVVKESLEEVTYEEEEVKLDEYAEEQPNIDMDGDGDVDADDVKKMVGTTEGYMEEEGLELDGTGMEGEESSEELDMTGASDEDVIAIYKKLSGDDEIEIVGDELHLNITEPGEYVVKLDSLEDVEDEESDIEPIGGDDEEEVEYDIEIGDEEEEEDAADAAMIGGDEEEIESDEEESDEEESDEEESDEEEIESDEEEIDETLAVTRGYAGRQGAKKSGSAHLPSPKESLDETIKAKQLVSETAKKYNALLTEAKKLKAENEEFRTALKEFRTKLVETVVFNSNLTYVTRLFMEHSTTKGEKQNIIKRFDEEVTNLKESKKLYKTIANELEVRKPIAESVENKIIKEAATSTSKQLNESTAYVDPSTKRIMDLINRVEKR
jgi:hypothetical protein